MDADGWVLLPDLFGGAEIDVLRGELPKVLAMHRDEVWREKDGEVVHG